MEKDRRILISSDLLYSGWANKTFFIWANSSEVTPDEFAQIKYVLFAHVNAA